MNQNVVPKALKQLPSNFFDLEPEEISKAESALREI